jgi:hypothetical protein
MYVLSQTFRKTSITEARKILTRMSKSVHGHYALPEGYSRKLLPTTVRISREYNNKVELPCFDNAVVSIGQVLFGGFTLWRARRDRLDRYDCAAFGLTVVPYLLMSFANLLGNIITPTYPTMFRLVNLLVR